MRIAGIGIVLITLCGPIASFAGQTGTHSPADVNRKPGAPGRKANAAGPKSGVDGRKIVHLLNCGATSAPDLNSQARESSVIAVGEVTSISQQGRVPMDPTYHGHSSDYYTIYNFKVSRYLRGKGSSEIKIFNDGMASDTLVFLYDRNPLLEEGKKYIVFLMQDNSGFSKRNGFVTYGEGGRFYKMADLDTFFFIHFTQGKLEITDKGVHAAQDRFRRMEDWKFRLSPQLVGLSEKEACAIIAKAVEHADHADRMSGLID